jgi:NTE family protein
MADAIASFLASSPIFGEVPLDQLEEIAKLFRAERHAAGGVILRKGDLSSAVYFLRSGQLAVRIDRGGWKETVAYLQPPDIFGELSFVTNRPCVADVEVVHDAEVLLLPRDAVPKLPQQRETILRALMKVIAGRLQETVTRGGKVRELPVVLLRNHPNWEAPWSFAWELARSLGRQSGHKTLLVNLGAVKERAIQDVDETFSVCHYAAPPTEETLRSELAQKLTDWKRHFQNIILNPAGPGAARFADIIAEYANWKGLLLGPGDPLPPEAGAGQFVVQSAARPTLPKLSGNSQLIWEAAESETAFLTGKPVSAAFRRTVDSMARCVGGLQLGLALGGGAAWGWAHIGILSVLENAGLPIDVISGCSMGSVVGAFRAAGFGVDRLKEIAHYWRTRTGSFINKRRLLVESKVLQFAAKRTFTRPFIHKRLLHLSLLSESMVRKTFREYFGDRLVNQTEIPYWANAVDIRTGKAYTIRDGTLVDCVRASIALPGLLAPAARDSHLLVDAGIMDPVPVSLVAEMIGGKKPDGKLDRHYVIGVNAMAELESQEISNGRLGRFFDVLTRCMFVMGHEIGEARAKQIADIVFTPSLGEITMLQFSRTHDIIECGRKAAEAQLPKILDGYERLKAGGSSEARAAAPAKS